MPPVPPRAVEQPPAQLVPYYKSECGRVVVYKGDNREVMKSLQAESVSAVVSDPPYGLGKEPDALKMLCDWLLEGHHDVTGGGFMGKEWDAFVPQPATWKIMSRVMKPGAHALIFGGTRTYDLVTLGLRIAEFELRDVVLYLYGAGFPKSHDVSKAIDKHLGADREKIRVSADEVRNPKATGGGRDGTEGATRPWIENAFHEKDGDEPATAAAAWKGFGTNLKPAYEPCILSRKPLIGTVAQNVLEHGTGGINIDGCRVKMTNEKVTRALATNENRQGLGTEMTTWAKLSKEEMNKRQNAAYDKQEQMGRWPANIIHDGSDEVVRLFPEQAGGGGADRERVPAARSGSALQLNTEGSMFTNGVGHDDSGSAARFFYTCKANGTDREDNRHPTVKPTDLMQYLVRLVAAKESLVMDPFMGSGSTGVACIREGMRFIGIEQSEEYCDIAVGRLKHELVQCGYAKPTPPPSVKVLKVGGKK